SSAFCGKSALIFPAVLASSTGSFFLQLANTSRAHIPRQGPTRLRRRRWPLASSSAFTEPSLIRRSSIVWQENFRKNKARRLAAEFGEHFAKGMKAVRIQQCLYCAIHCYDA